MWRSLSLSSSTKFLEMIRYCPRLSRSLSISSSLHPRSHPLTIFFQSRKFRKGIRLPTSLCMRAEARKKKTATRPDPLSPIFWSIKALSFEKSRVRARVLSLLSEIIFLARATQRCDDEREEKEWKTTLHVCVCVCVYVCVCVCVCSHVCGSSLKR